MAARWREEERRAFVASGPALSGPVGERAELQKGRALQSTVPLPPPPFSSVSLRNRPDIPKSPAGNLEIDQEASLPASWASSSKGHSAPGLFGQARGPRLLNTAALLELSSQAPPS